MPRNRPYPDEEYEEFIERCTDDGTPEDECDELWELYRAECGHPERRFAAHPVTLETRDSGKPLIVGYASVFYRADDPGTQYQLHDGVVERINRAAFNQAIKDDDVRALFNHDPNQLLGRTAAGTLRLSADDRGLRYEIDPPDTQVGRDVMESIRRGDLTGSSFAFQIAGNGEEVREEGSVLVREVTNVKLFDVGPVTYPAYSSSSAGVRSADKRLLQRLARCKCLQAKLAAYRARAIEIGD